MTSFRQCGTVPTEAPRSAWQVKQAGVAVGTVSSMVGEEDNDGQTLS